MKELLTDHLTKSQFEKVMRTPILYGDFHKALDEAEPRIYDDLIEYDVVKALFIEVRPLEWSMHVGSTLYMVVYVKTYVYA